jgi:Domain of unknown function (DUF4157)
VFRARTERSSATEKDTGRETQADSTREESPQNRVPDPASSTPEWDFGRIAVRNAVDDARAEDGVSPLPDAEALSAALDRSSIRQDAGSNASVRLLGADAMTIGDTILFREGVSLAIGSPLLAHELVHVINQQGQERRAPRRSVSGDVLAVQYTRTLAELMADDELESNVRILQEHVLATPDDEGALENLRILEEVARDRIETDRVAASTSPEPKPEAPATAAAQVQPPEPEEPHNKLWHAAHSIGLVTTKHERAQLYRKAWGRASGVVVTDRDGNPIDVDRLSDDEVIALNARLRNIPVGWYSTVPIVPVSWPLETDETGKIHGELPDAREAQSKIKSMTREQLEQSAEELEKSISSRASEQVRLGEEGAHRARIEEERDLLRAIRKLLGGS